MDCNKVTNHSLLTEMEHADTSELLNHNYMDLLDGWSSDLTHQSGNVYKIHKCMSSPWWYNNIATCYTELGMHSSRSQNCILYIQGQRKKPKPCGWQNMPLRPPWTILFQSEKRRWKITLSGETKDKHNLNIKTRLMKISLPFSFYQLGFMTQKNGHMPHDKFQNSLEKNQECSLKGALFCYQELKNYLLSLLAYKYNLPSK